jgi:hypothetical protein
MMESDAAAGAQVAGPHSQLTMIIDFTVEQNSNLTILIAHRLIARCNIDYCRSAMAKKDLLALV